METLGYICTCYWEKPGIEAMIGLVQGLYVARDLLRRFVDTEHYITYACGTQGGMYMGILIE